MRTLLALALLALPVFAQDAQISGLVHDPAGRLVPNARIAVLNHATGGIRNAASNQSGFYAVPSLASGRYKITVEADGFETAVRDEVKLERSRPRASTSA